MSIEDNWLVRRISDLIVENRLRGGSGSSAKKITVKLYGNGVVPSRSAGGSDNTLYFRRRSGQFIFSKLDFLNGAFGIIPPNLDGYESTADLPAFDFKEGVDQNWFLATVSRPAFYTRYKGFAIGSRKANRVPTGEFLASKISVPPYAEQLAIAEVLQSVEDAIARKRELIGTLGETKKAVMRELLTKGTRLDNAVLKPLPERWVLGRIAEGVDQIPNDWKLVRLTTVAKLESGHTPNRDKPEYWGGTIPWLSLGDTDALDQLTIEDTLEQVTEKGIKNSSARVLPVDTVIFSRTATVGKACRLAVEMATSQDFANWVCGSDLDPRYLVQVFRHMKREWDRLQAGSTHQTIYMPTFKRLQILLPPKAEQEKIADTGEAFDRRIEAEKQSLAELQNTRAALAQELLSGRLRLPASMVARFENASPSGKTSVAVTA
ncbi:MAG: restriction endonuclease subunit S [Roseovarius sp.]